MKLASIPVAVKVGSAGVIGGGGIAGTGLLVHDQIQKSKIRQEQENEAIYKLKNLDKELIKDSKASLDFSAESGKEDFAHVGGDKKSVSITIVASSNENGSKFKKDTSPVKWACVIKGFVKNIDLKLDNDDKNFDKTSQKPIFKNELAKKEGFVKSCSRNRTEEPSAVSESVTSEIRVELKEITKTETPLTKQYEFPTEVVNSIFEGTYTNPK